MNRRGTVVFSLCGLLSSTACSSIINGTTQPVTVYSNVRGAQVFVDNTLVGTTPYSGPVKRGCKTLRVTSPGYGENAVPLTTEVEGWFWGNILFGGFLGSTTDAADGAMHKYTATSYNVPLRPMAPPVGYAPPASTGAAGDPTHAPGASAPAPIPAR
jgi:hypothetical protein